MRNPFKRGEILDDNDPSGCGAGAFSVVVLMLSVVGGVSFLAYYGVSEFLARV